jgi:hypothetical protein
MVRELVLTDISRAAQSKFFHALLDACGKSVGVGHLTAQIVGWENVCRGKHDAVMMIR